MADNWWENDPVAAAASPAAPSGADADWWKSDPEVVSPEKQGQQTLQSISRGEAPLPTTGQELLDKTGPYYRSSALGRDVKAIKEGLFGGPGFLSNIGTGIAGLASSVKGGYNAAVDELTNSVNSDIQGEREMEAKYPTWLGQHLPQMASDALAVINGNTLPAIPASIAAAAGTGAYKTVAPLVKGGVKIGSDIGLDATRAVARAASSQDLADAAALSEAQRDRARLQVERGIEAPVLQAVTEGSSLPAVTEAASNLVPFALPVGGGIEAGGFARRIGSAIERGNPVAATAGRVVQGAGEVVDELANHSKYAGMATAIANASRGHFGEGLVEGALVPYALKKVQPIAQATAQFGKNLAETGATAQSRALGQIAGAGINTAAATGTGLLYGLGGSEPGEEAEGVRSGAAMGLALSPLAVIGGSFTRQNLEQAAENANLAKIGEPNVIGADNLSPKNAQTVKAIQGLITGLDTTQGNGVKTIVQTPEEFAKGAQTVNNGQVTDAAASKARGYYNDAKGNIVLNAAYDDLVGAMHEATHAAADILPGIDPTAARELNESVQRAALDSSGEATQGFQRFLDAYQKRKVDWSKLPDHGGESKAYYLREFGAQTGLALKNLRGGGLQNPGQYALRPELSDLVFNALGDWARRTGIKSSPDVSEALPGQTNEPIPADPQALAQTREMLYRVGQAPKAEAATIEAEPGVLEAASSTPVEAVPKTTEIPSRNTDAYQTAQTFLTLPKTRLGQGMDAETAQARLDAAAANPDVPNTVEDYIYYAQTGRPRASRENTLLPPSTPRESVSVAEREPQVERVAVAQMEQPEVARSTTPEAEETSPALTPRVELTSEVYKTQPPNAGDVIRNGVPEDLAPHLTAEQASDIRTFTTAISARRKILESGKSQGKKITDEDRLSIQDGITEREGLIQDALNDAHQAMLIRRPTRSSEQSQPLSADDIAGIRQQVADNFTPKPHNPRGTPAERESKRNTKAAEELADAQFRAVWEAHKPTAEPGAVQLKVDPETGKQKVSGRYFNEDDALHNEILSRLDDETRQNLSAVQQSIASGTPSPLNIDYFSADPLRTQKTAAQREESQAASPADLRSLGDAPGLNADKEFYPLNLNVTKDGNVTAFGFSPDKLIGNADKILSYFTDNNIKFPYSDVNDPRFVSDIAGYAANHANGFKGDGSGALVASKAIAVRATEGYEPYKIDKQRADAMNLIMGNEGAKSPPKGYDQRPSANLREFAKLNGITPSEAGEVNSLRQQINDAQNLRSGPDVGTKKVLESPFENIRMDLITRLKPSEGAPPDFSNLRAQAYRGDRGAVVRGGLPNSKFAGAGFLPAKEAGATSGQAADAARQWQEKGTDSPYFQKWFGKSKVVDEGGKPLIVYHGSPNDFDVFNQYKQYNGEYGQMFMFTPDKQYAERYAFDGKLGKTGDVRPFYVSSQKLFDARNPSHLRPFKKLLRAEMEPWELQAYMEDYFNDGLPHWSNSDAIRFAQQNGYDGIKLFERNGIESYGVFSPEQIKSAIGNRGTFDPANPNINFLPSREYPLAPEGTRYEENSAPISWVSPDDFLKAVRPLKIDESSRDNIDDLKDHILSGKRLDPLHIRSDGKEDGRHRAVAARELGIKKVPVIDERTDG